MKEPKIGEVYFCVPNDKRWNKPFYITVNRVGKKFFYSDNNHKTLKFDKQNLRHENNGYSPAYVLYDNEEEYNTKIKAIECWLKISNGLYRKMTDKEIIELYDKLKDR